MNPFRPRSPAVVLLALALGAALLEPPGRDARAFSTTGGSLSIFLRDVRVFDNFSAATANDNLAADPSFPGYTGAELAIWKGAVEWGSRLHGAGEGDPHQPGGLGSGGANFDPTWQGSASVVGGINDNIHSELTGSSGGILAFTETPIVDGWRIRYYSIWAWDDDPGVGTPGIDLQGVACHEYGHALGLGHSTSPGSTMATTLIGNGSNQRSLEADDVSGVQAVYGAAAAYKPRVITYSLAPGLVTVQGLNFAAEGNIVWLTRAGSGGDGTPVKAFGLASSGGLISFSLPAGAGPGDLLVQNAGSTSANLSNAFPFDPLVAPPPPPPNPSITSVSPPQVQAFQGGTIVLTGSGFTGAQQVISSGKALLPPFGFTVVDDATLVYTAPQAASLGPTSVVVVTPFGDSAPASFDYVETHPPKHDSLAVAGSSNPYTWNFGAGAGDVAFVLYSASPTTFALGGIPILIDYTIAGAVMLGPTGIGKHQIVLPPGQVGKVFHTQVVTGDPAMGKFVGATAVTMVTVLF